MTAQQLMQDSHIVRMRALRDEVTRLKAALAQANDELESLRHHFALALLAARDADRLEPGGALLIVDGWNAILGSVRIKSVLVQHAAPPVKESNADQAAEPSAQQAASSPKGPGLRKQLEMAVRKWLEAHPNDHAWIVFDGAYASGKTRGRLRISYTGGTGAQRADRLVCDYLRMRQYDGRKGRVIVVTNDKTFRTDAERLGAEIAGIEELNGNWVMAITKERAWIKK